MNTADVIEVALLLLVAFLVGCVVGYFLRRWFGPAERRAAPMAPAERATPASPLPPMSRTEIAARPRSTATISGAMAGAATAAGASDIAAQATDRGGAAAENRGGAEPPAAPAVKEPPAAPRMPAEPATTQARETHQPKPAGEGEAPGDIGDLGSMDGASPEMAGKPAAEDRAGDAALDSSAEADFAVGTGGRPVPLDGPRGGRKDELQRIKGIGPKLEATLNGLGVYHFDQIAGWSRGNIEWVDAYLSFKGRIDREDWVAQARAISGGSTDVGG